MNYRRNPIRMERAQQRLDAGTVSDQFPDVAGIVISMIYNQKGIKKSLQRTVNYSPGSYAFFKVDCLNKGCGDGGFDLTQVVTTMAEATERRQRENSVAGAIVRPQTTRTLFTKFPFNIHKRSCGVARRSHLERLFIMDAVTFAGSKEGRGGRARFIAGIHLMKLNRASSLFS